MHKLAHADELADDIAELNEFSVAEGGADGGKHDGRHVTGSPVHRLGETDGGALTIGERVARDIAYLAPLHQFLLDHLKTGPVHKTTVQSIVTAVERGDPQADSLLRTQLDDAGEEQRPIELRPGREETRCVAHCPDPPGINTSIDERLQLIGDVRWWEQRHRHRTRRFRSPTRSWRA